MAFTHADYSNRTKRSHNRLSRRVAPSARRKRDGHSMSGSGLGNLGYFGFAMVR